MGYKHYVQLTFAGLSRADIDAQVRNYLLSNENSAEEKSEINVDDLKARAVNARAVEEMDEETEIDEKTEEAFTENSSDADAEQDEEEEEAPAPAKAAKTKQAEYSLDDVIKACQAYAKAMAKKYKSEEKGRAAVKAVLTKFGVKKSADLTTAQRAQVVRALAV